MNSEQMGEALGAAMGLRLAAFLVGLVLLVPVAFVAMLALGTLDPIVYADIDLGFRQAYALGALGMVVRYLWPG